MQFFCTFILHPLPHQIRKFIRHPPLEPFVADIHERFLHLAIFKKHLCQFWYLWTYQFKHLLRNNPYFLLSMLVQTQVKKMKQIMQIHLKGIRRHHVLRQKLPGCLRCNSSFNKVIIKFQAFFCYPICLLIILIKIIRTI